MEFEFRVEDARAPTPDAFEPFARIRVEHHPKNFRGVRVAVVAAAHCRARRHRSTSVHVGPRRDATRGHPAQEGRPCAQIYLNIDAHTLKYVQDTIRMSDHISIKYELAFFIHSRHITYSVCPYVRVIHTRRRTPRTHGARAPCHDASRGSPVCRRAGIVVLVVVVLVVVVVDIVVSTTRRAAARPNDVVVVVSRARTD